MSIRCSWVDPDGVQCPGVGIESRSTRGGKRFCRAHADCRSAYGGMLIIDAMVIDSIGGAVLTQAERNKVIARIAKRKADSAPTALDASAVIARRRKENEQRALAIYAETKREWIRQGEDRKSAHELALLAVYHAGHRTALRMPAVKPTGADRRAGLEVD